MQDWVSEGTTIYKEFETGGQWGIDEDRSVHSRHFFVVHDEIGQEAKSSGFCFKRAPNNMLRMLEPLEAFFRRPVESNRSLH